MAHFPPLFVATPAATSRRYRRFALVALAALAASLATAGCTVSPSAEIERAELLLGISDAVATLREENATLQEQVDALEIVVARQDTLLRRVAAANGIPVTGP